MKDYLKNNLRRGRLVCLTGAGISVESGIPAFRGKDGLWQKYDPEIYANTSGLKQTLRNHPGRLVSFLRDFYTALLDAHPNQAHLALAQLEKNGILTAVITQNIDNLHQDAGTQSVVELHGNAFRLRCIACGKTAILKKERIKEMLGLLGVVRDSRIKLLRLLSRYFPRCGCGQRYRIDIVLFGEILPENALSMAYRYLEMCNTLLLIGSSLVVYPAAGLPLYAKQKGAKIVEVNSQDSALSDLCDYKIRGPASRVLPEILNLIGN